MKGNVRWLPVTDDELALSGWAIVILHTENKTNDKAVKKEIVLFMLII
jgi:hypothetical protein